MKRKIVLLVMTLFTLSCITGCGNKDTVSSKTKADTNENTDAFVEEIQDEEFDPQFSKTTSAEYPVVIIDGHRIEIGKTTFQDMINDGLITEDQIICDTSDNYTSVYSFSEKTGCSLIANKTEAVSQEECKDLIINTFKYQKDESSEPVSVSMDDISSDSTEEEVLKILGEPTQKDVIDNDIIYYWENFSKSEMETKSVTFRNGVINYFDCDYTFF